MVAAAVCLAVIAGMCSSVQGSTNTSLASIVGRAQATFVSFAGGVLVLGVAVLVAGTGGLSHALELPPWLLCSGVLGFYILMSVVYVTPRLGVAHTLMLLMFGKLLTGACIDVFGMFSLEPRELGIARVLGLALVAGGIVLVSVGRLRAQPKSVGAASGLGDVVKSSLIMLSAGAANAIQAPILSTLAGTTGQLEASFVNFVGGVLCAGIYLLVISRGHVRFESIGQARPWQFLGGLYGAIVVLIVTVTTPVLGVGLLVSSQMCGQLFGGMVIDARGWLGCRRIPVSPWRLGGIALIACGMLVLA